mmetsp:Transcript_5155/g.18866  ORF Transcript_5155/g.18866 Transcript_5155/m.18866 type:complete len:234 (+) Transcript_5155:1595-2296(+)
MQLRVHQPWALLGVPVLLCLNKLLIISTRPDPASRNAAAALCDVGFLSFLAALAWYAAEAGPATRLLRPMVALVGMSHLLLEMLVVLGVGGAKWGPELYAHHLSACVAFAICLLFPTPGFQLSACRLTFIECTAALPVALREAREHGRFKGDYMVGFTALMFAAFTWRCYFASTIMYQYITATRAPLLAAAGLPVTLLCDAASGTLWAVNFIWLEKLYRGARKALAKTKPQSA